MQTLVAAAVLGVLMTPGAWAQSVAMPGGNGRGGITFVTRRLPTSGAGVPAAGMFAAGGLALPNQGGIAMPLAPSAPAVAVSRPTAAPIADERALAALRVLAARGDRGARQLLQERAAQARPARR